MAESAAAKSADPGSQPPHAHHVSISKVELTPVPLFNRLRNGCRPFCEVYVGEKRVMTTSREYNATKYVLTGIAEIN